MNETTNENRIRDYRVQRVNWWSHDVAENIYMRPIADLQISIQSRPTYTVDFRAVAP